MCEKSSDLYALNISEICTKKICIYIQIYMQKNRLKNSFIHNS